MMSEAYKRYYQSLVKTIYTRELTRRAKIHRLQETRARADSAYLYEQISRDEWLKIREIVRYNIIALREEMRK